MQQPNGSLLKRNEGTGQLSYSKRPERPVNTNKVDQIYFCGYENKPVYHYQDLQSGDASMNVNTEAVQQDANHWLH